jgi:uncharacterized oxidoreductase
MLCGGLSGGRCSNPADPMAGVGNTVLFVVFNPSFFGGTDHFVQQSTGLAEFVRSCPTAPGQQITLPGDPERRSKTQREQTGISIPDGTWKLMCDTASECQVPVPEVR